MDVLCTKKCIKCFLQTSWVADPSWSQAEVTCGGVSTEELSACLSDLWRSSKSQLMRWRRRDTVREIYNFNILYHEFYIDDMMCTYIFYVQQYLLGIRRVAGCCYNSLDWGSQFIHGIYWGANSCSVLNIIFLGIIKVFPSWTHIMCHKPARALKCHMLSRSFKQRTVYVSKKHRKMLARMKQSISL